MKDIDSERGAPSCFVMSSPDRGGLFSFQCDNTSCDISTENLLMCAGRGTCDCGTCRCQEAGIAATWLQRFDTFIFILSVTPNAVMQQLGTSFGFFISFIV